MKKLTRDRVVPIISASVSWLIFAMIGSGLPSLPKFANRRSARSRWRGVRNTSARGRCGRAISPRTERSNQGAGRAKEVGTFLFSASHRGGEGGWGGRGHFIFVVNTAGRRPPRREERRGFWGGGGGREKTLERESCQIRATTPSMARWDGRRVRVSHRGAGESPRFQKRAGGSWRKERGVGGGHVGGLGVPGEERGAQRKRGVVPAEGGELGEGRELLASW